MTPAEARASFERLAGRRSEAVTLRRPGSPDVDVALRAVPKTFSTDTLTPDHQETARMWIVGAEQFAGSALAAGPAINDRIIWSGRTLRVSAVDDTKRRVAGELIAYEVTTVGA